MKNSLLLLFILFFFTVKGQNQIQRYVIASAGKFSKSITLPAYIYSISYTIGEPIVFGKNSSPNKLSNGFQQPDVVIIKGGYSPSGGTLTAIGISDNPFQVYPNPFSTFIKVEGPSSVENSTIIQLIDANGKLIYDNIMETDFINITIDESIALGTYFLNFYSKTGDLMQQTKLIKSNSNYNEK